MNIEITDIAAEEIKNAFKDNEITEPFIVFYVAGGGCSGLQYGLAISDGEPEIDEIITYSKDIKIAVESKSAK